MFPLRSLNTATPTAIFEGIATSKFAFIDPLPLGGEAQSPRGDIFPSRNMSLHSSAFAEGWKILSGWRAS